MCAKLQRRIQKRNSIDDRVHGFVQNAYRKVNINTIDNRDLFQNGTKKINQVLKIAVEIITL